jgi:hypothetical protein
MHRLVSYQYSEAISAAMDYVPNSMHSLFETVDFLTGTDPLFVGLHNYETTGEYSYRNICHTVYPLHQTLPKSLRKPTIVLPKVPTLWTVLHELGHVLHWYYDLKYIAKPTTEYAKTSHYEAFAEAFTEWFSFDWEKHAYNDPNTYRLFLAW